MKKNGFTLIEILGVITLLAIIFTITTVVVTKIVANGRNTTYQKQINDILNAAYDWSLSHVNKLPMENRKTYITLNELKKEGLISANLTDPKTQKKFSDDLVISISNVGGNYKYNDPNSKQGGDYLYRVETDLMNSKDYDYFRPKIILEGTGSETYTSKYNLGSDYTYPSYSAKDSDGLDITDSIVITTVLNNTMVEGVDTSKVGIYYVIYTVVDSKGYSASIIRNIIIADEEAPTLTLPDNETISTSITSYDLMKGVVCTDNSNTCKVTTSGTIKFGTIGKYVIKYTAKDESGNTTTKKRVITVQKNS